MSDDDDFDAVLDKYFAIKGSWSLFIAICLYEKIDPENHKTPITDVYLGHKSHEEPDFKVRLCKIAIGSINDAKLGHALDFDGIPNLVGKHDRPDEIGAAQYSVDPRKFVPWAVKKWPYDTAHLKAAEDRYQAKKKHIGLNPAEKDEVARQEFLRMVARGEFDLKDHARGISKAATTLADRVNKHAHLYTPESLRKKIPMWVEDELAKKYQNFD